ncbi:hypothetical protein ACFLZX_00975 [Nanoarchaeota archaeon]
MDWQSIKGKKIIFFGMIPIVVLLNYLTGVLSTYLGIPFFLDTWATSLGVMVAGLGVGLAGGVIYNIVMALTVWGFPAWIWAFSNIWIAIITFILWKRNLIDIRRPGVVLLCGIIIGLTNSVVTIIIKFFAFGGLPTYAGTEPTYAAFLALTGSTIFATIGEHVTTELADKTVSIFIAAIVLSSLPKKFILTKKRD